MKNNNPVRIAFSAILSAAALLSVAAFASSVENAKILQEGLYTARGFADFSVSVVADGDAVTSVTFQAQVDHGASGVLTCTNAVCTGMDSYGNKDTIRLIDESHFQFISGADPHNNAIFAFEHS